MKNRFCQLFGVQHPIMQGGMQWLATPELAAAVSNAGGLGTINASISKDKEDLVRLIRSTKDLTDKPFALNISMLPNLAAGDRTDEFMDTAIEQHVPVVETCGRSPADYVPALHAAGIRVIHKVTSVRHAIKAEQAGVDAISVVGFEAGGHPGMDYVGTFVLIPAVANIIQIPLLAGGGVCDGRGYMAARCLGADGVLMGTRFMASEECWLPEPFKQGMVSAGERDTILVQKTIRNACRVWKNQACMSLYEREAHGDPTLEEVLSVVNGARQKRCYETGDVQTGAFPCGQCVGLIQSVQPAAEIIRNILQEAQVLCAQLGPGGTP